MSEKNNDHVVLFKSVSETENLERDPYYEAIFSAGYEVTLVPVLDFEFFNLKLLLTKFKRHNDYAGIIFSSPRCVMGLELSVKQGNDSSLLDNWSNHKNYVVGENTGKLAENLGFVVHGKESGNTNALAKIISRDKHKKPFLFPTGSFTQANFMLMLQENGIELDDVVIYETIPHPQLEENISKVKSDELSNKTIYFAYFSPTGVKFTLPFLKKLEFDLDSIKFIAIGPVTEAELLNSGFKVEKTSVKPNPDSLLNAILSLKT